MLGAVGAEDSATAVNAIESSKADGFAIDGSTAGGTVVRIGVVIVGSTAAGTDVGIVLDTGDLAMRNT